MVERQVLYLSPTICNTVTRLVDRRATTRRLPAPGAADLLSGSV